MMNVRTAALATIVLAASLCARGAFMRASAAFPGMNGRIVFNSGQRDPNDRDIWIMNPDGSGQTDLTNNPKDDHGPTWAPHGLEIAFEAERDGNQEIYVMNPDGSGQTNITNSPSDDLGPAYSPDGSKIAFYSNRAGGNNDIYVMNADGSGVQRLTTDPAPDQRPAWSPDGTKIAFITNRDGNFEIYVMNNDGSNQTNITHNPANDGGDPDWSPNGQQIAFWSDRDGNAEIYKMNADGTGVTRLTNNPASDSWPAWSPDGSKIVFASDRASGNFEIYVMDSNGGNPTRLTNNSAFDGQPDWQSLDVPPTATNTPTMTNTATETPTATPTFTPTNTATPTATPRPALVMDVAAENDGRPCGQVDTFRDVSQGQTYKVAACLFAHPTPPASFDLSMNYASAYGTGSVVHDPAPSLNDNPDANDGSASTKIGLNWDCNAGSEPSEGPPAHIACGPGSGQTQTLTVQGGNLATFEMHAVTPYGWSQMSFVNGTSVDGVPCDAAHIVCYKSVVYNLPPVPSNSVLSITGSQACGSYTTAQDRLPAGASAVLLRASKVTGGKILGYTVHYGSPGERAFLSFKMPAAAGVAVKVESFVNGSNTAAATVVLTSKSPCTGTDPGGHVTDAANGAPISGASVTLERFDGTQFVALDPASQAGLFDPAENPIQTGLLGEYGWDAVPGDYRVSVSAPGCAPATSSTVTVPPPATAVGVSLTCTDTDGDGIRGEDEVNLFGTDPNVSDTDGNGVADGAEDSDLDGLNNLDELRNGTNPTTPDSDGDGITDGDEVHVYGTQPLASDSDLDGLNDGDEVNTYGSNPLSADSDGDTLNDGDEVNVYGTSPAKADTDGDGCGDGKEVTMPALVATNPWDFYSVPVPALIAAPNPAILFKDSAVTAADAQAVFAYFKAGAHVGAGVYEQDLNGNATKDGIEYDRTVMGPGMSGPPDGTVAASDAQLAFAQFKLGYHC